MLEKVQFKSGIHNMTYDRSLVQFGVVAPFWPYDRIMKVAKMTEELGFDSMWQADHTVGHLVHLEAFDIWALYAYIAAVTKRVKLGIGVTEPHRRNPALLAQSGTTLDWVSNGRLILGMGAGEAINCLPFGIDMSKPVTKLEESAELVKRFWTEKYIDHDGTFFHMKDASIQPFPVQKPHPPLWIAGNGPRTLQSLAKEMALRLRDEAQTTLSLVALAQPISTEGDDLSGQPPQVFLSLSDGDKTVIRSHRFNYKDNLTRRWLDVRALDLIRRYLIKTEN